VSEVVIVDSGVANLASVQHAFVRLGAAVGVTRDPAVARVAARLVLPGVGAFGAGIGALRSRGLDAAVLDAVASGTPVLAICLGMQMLCESSEESPGVSGLGLVPGTCTRLPDEVRVPHLGWNAVDPDPACRFVSPMDAAWANSYALPDAPRGWAAAWTTHGTRFVAALERDAVMACQFHPELSGAAGRELMRRWLTREELDRQAVPRGPSRESGLAVRIVPCLDVQDGRVVKGVQFADLRDAGDPAEQAARYEAQGADEIVMLDIAASPSSRSTQVETVRQVRAVLGIPLTVGGGVRSVDEAQRILAAGADKVSVNSAAVARPNLLAELAREFGSQCIVLAIDARQLDGGWEVLVLGGRQRAGLDVLQWAQRGVALGAGEILLTSWDRDGTRRGCDLELLNGVSAAVTVPVIASGGIGTRAHVVDAIAAGAGAVLAASVFHDGDDTVAAIKQALAGQGVRVRQ
jgi:imidazole glycerol phosphate synthase glutamine amidotransferase subunit